MTTPAFLEVVAHSLTAMLGVWLGLLVLTRSRTPSSLPFGLLSLSIAGWSSSIILQRLTTSPDVEDIARSIEELGAAVLIAGTLHFAASVATDARLPSGRFRVVVLAYAGNLLLSAPTIVDHAISPPHLATGPLPGALFGWAWVLVRLGTLVLAAAVLLQAQRRIEEGGNRRRQVRAALATVTTGGLGGALRFLPGVGDNDAWIGVSLVTLAVVLASYAVFASGIFFNQAVAGRAFRTSLLGGLGLSALTGILLIAEAVGRSVTGLDTPFFLVLTLVIAATMYEPVTRWLASVLGSQGPRSLARDRLLRAMGLSTLTARPAEAGVEPALDRLARALDVTGLAVVRPDGSRAAWGGIPPTESTVAPVPLISGDEVLGELRVGPTVSGALLSPLDVELLRLSAGYLAAALLTGRRESEQAEKLVHLAEERARVENRASTLHEALVQHADSAAGLHVWALGTLRVERSGEPITRWGGDKAGTRQAEGIFAFLLDRGERGMTKDEALELIWPDVDLERADLAFHRTMVGLRGALEQGISGRSGRAIRYVNGRYRLDPRVIAWSDVDTFVRRLDAARSASGLAERLQLLEEARALYRGEYLDDCPFYGDSSQVEEQRERFRARLVDVLVAVGEGYEASGDRLAALDAYREAERRALDGSGQARAAIGRLTVA